MKETLRQKSPRKSPFLYWTKDAFSLNYSIYKKGELVGHVIDKNLNRSIKASLLGNNYLFESEGIIKNHINIYDMSNKTEIGRIHFEIIRPRANIELADDLYYWKFNNLFQTKWVLKDSNRRIIISGNKRKEGTFDNHPKVKPILLLCSLIIRNRFIKHGY